MTLINQSKSAIVYDMGKEALSAVGISIVMAAEATVAVAAAGAGNNYHGRINQMSFIDTVVDCSAANNATGFRTTASLYLRNVYLRGCAVAVDSPSLLYKGPAGGGQAQSSVLLTNITALRPILHGEAW